MDASLTTDSVMTLKVSELKSALTERGLETNGVKATLQKRLIAALGAASTGMEVEASADAAPADEYDIDETTRYSGTVVRYFKRKGFGHICPDGKDAEKKEDLVFVHWKQIQSSDEWPALAKDQKVEYYLATKRNPKNPKKQMFAANVTGEGGLQVVWTDDRTYPDRSARFVATVEFFDPKKGFGFLKPKEDFAFDEKDFLASKKGNIYVAREDLKTADEVETSPALKRAAEVEFTLYKRKEDGNYGAADVTMPGAVPFGKDDLWLRKPRDPNAPRRKRKKKGKKRKANQMMQNIKPLTKKQMKALKKQMGGMMLGNMFGGKQNRPMMIPMGGMMGGMPMMMGGGMPQMMMMGNQPYMVMGQAGGKRKKRRKNKKKKAQN